MHRLSKILSVVCATVALTACKQIPSYTDDFKKAHQQIHGMTLDAASAEHIGHQFVSTFNTLGTPTFIERASTLYADQLFINDTLSQFTEKEQLIEHFKGMNKRVSQVNVHLISTTFHLDSVYVHWSMSYRFQIFGTHRDMHSYGISQIKVNTNQQIIFQQDYWDPANGLYRSLPYVGGVYGWFLPFKKSY